LVGILVAAVVLVSSVTADGADKNTCGKVHGVSIHSHGVSCRAALRVYGANLNGHVPSRWTCSASLARCYLDGFDSGRFMWWKRTTYRPLIPRGQSASGTDSNEAQVICLTEWGYQPTGAYFNRPHSCDLHKRGELPAVHLNIAVVRRLQWLHWGGKVAVAKGRIGISTYGLAPLKLRLEGLRQLCGRSVYTKARLFVTVRYDGKTHHSRNSIPLDTCLR
jgi:hypothetical protein